MTGEVWCIVPECDLCHGMYHVNHGLGSFRSIDDAVDAIRAGVVPVGHGLPGLKLTGGKSYMVMAFGRNDRIGPLKAGAPR